MVTPMRSWGEAYLEDVRELLRTRFTCEKEDLQEGLRDCRPHLPPRLYRELRILVMLFQNSSGGSAKSPHYSQTVRRYWTTVEAIFNLPLNGEEVASLRPPSIEPESAAPKRPRESLDMEPPAATDSSAISPTWSIVRDDTGNITEVTAHSGLERVARAKALELLGRTENEAIIETRCGPDSSRKGRFTFSVSAKPRKILQSTLNYPPNVVIRRVRRHPQTEASPPSPGLLGIGERRSVTGGIDLGLFLEEFADDLKLGALVDSDTGSTQQPHNTK